jgi:hypothetical protein
MAKRFGIGGRTVVFNGPRAASAVASAPPIACVRYE